MSKVDNVLSVGMKGMAGYKNQIINLAKATEGLDVQNTLLVLSQKGLSAETAKGVLEAKKLKTEQIAQAMSTYSVAGSQTVATGTTFSLSAAFKGLTAAIWENIKAFATWLVTTPAGIAVLVTGTIAAALAISDALGTTVEEQREKLEDYKKEYEEIISELKSLNDELATTEKRIKELEQICHLT